MVEVKYAVHEEEGKVVDRPHTKQFGASKNVDPGRAVHLHLLVGVLPPGLEGSEGKNGRTKIFLEAVVEWRNANRKKAAIVSTVFTLDDIDPLTALAEQALQ